MQVLEFSLSPGESVISESGEVSWMLGDVQMRTATAVGSQQHGLFGAAKRMLSGGSLFMSEYTATSTNALVAFATKSPGEIKEIPLEPGHDYIVHKHGFIAAEGEVQLSLFLQKKLGAGVFGGEGFVLQKISGQGVAYIEMGGEVVEYDLQAGESLRVHPGHIALFEAAVTLEWTTIPGIKNKFFGGDGLFLAQLDGPGKVWLQSLTLAGLADALAPYLPTQTTTEHSSGSSMLGDLLNN
jgi:uncharacterized protein (AIM24 family)